MNPLYLELVFSKLYYYISSEVEKNLQGALMYSICIPTIKPESELTDLLNEIKEKTTDCYEVIVVAEKQSASKNRNACLNRIRSNHEELTVIMLDDDVKNLPKGWNETLAAPLRINDLKCMLVSARLMSADGKTPGAMTDFNPDITSPYVEVKVVPSACIAFRRTDLRFDEQYQGSGYEDSDFVMQFKQKFPDKKVYVNNLCKVSHTNEQKNGTGTTYEKNQALFMEKWHGVKPLPSFPITDKKVSLCMIVKNEEKFLEQCLQSALGVVDEMVIIDTGSSDKTVEIALRYTKQVFHLDWPGSFADARNYAISKATGDWVLFMDADEIIHQGTREDLQFLVNVPVKIPVVYSVQILNIISPTSSVQHHMVRLFPRNRDFEYRGSIHEFVRSKSDTYFINSMTDKILLHHFGYTEELIEEKGKSKRNIDMLKAELKKEPDNLLYLYHLGTSYKVIGDLDNAEKCFLKWVNMIEDEVKRLKTPIDVSMGYAAYLGTLHQKKLFKTMIEVGRKVDSRCSQNPDFNLNYAIALNEEGFLDEALKVSLRYSSTNRSSFSAVSYDKDANGWKIFAVIGNIYQKMGNLENSIKYWEMALVIQKSNFDLYKMLITTYAASQKFDKVLETTALLHDTFPERPAPEDVKVAYANALFNTGKIGEAVMVFRTTERPEYYVQQLLTLLVSQRKYNHAYAVQQVLDGLSG